MDICRHLICDPLPFRHVLRMFRYFSMPVKCMEGTLLHLTGCHFQALQVLIMEELTDHHFLADCAQLEIKDQRAEQIRIRQPMRILQ